MAARRIRSALYLTSLFARATCQDWWTRRETRFRSMIQIRRSPAAAVLRGRLFQETLFRPRGSVTPRTILSYVPQPTLAGVYNNYPSTGSSITNYAAYTFKVDEYFTPTQHLSGTWIQSYNDNNGPYSILPAPVESTRDGATNVYTGRINYDWSLS